MKKTLLAVLGLLCTVTMAAGFASCGLLGGSPTPTPTPTPTPPVSSTTRPGNSSSNKPQDSSSAKPEDSSSAAPETSSPNENTEVGTLSITTMAGQEKDVFDFAFNSTNTLSLTASFALGSKFEVTLSNENLTYNKGNNVILFNKATKAGVTTLTVTAEDDNGNEVVATKTIVVKPQDMTINEVKLGTSNIEGIYTLASSNVQGAASSYDFNVSCGAAESVGADFEEYVVWESSSNAVTVDKDGKVSLAKTGEAELVTLTAKFIVNGVEYKASNPYTFRAVYEGVNVGSYADLHTATKSGKEIVLTNNIDFPTNVADIQYDWMETTYDKTYYKNTDTLADARVKTLLQFKNDLYGNGYIINAHNATAGLLDRTGALTSASLFRGPLHFVAMQEKSSDNYVAGSPISVKAQDNICFALFEGVTVKNVELRGCDLQADSEGNYDLTDLTYIGTVVEVLGDNVSIEQSRLTNGRTVLRVFGDVNDSSKVIKLNIVNSVLSSAREFIIRMGSNCFVDGKSKADVANELDENSLYLPGDDNTKNEYLTKKTYNTMTSAEKAAYDEKYIKTYVTLKNSVLKDAGIFAVGMDSHFSGGALHQGHPILDEFGDSVSQYWRNIAKTSYGAKLTFEGQVMMYNWKPLNQIDSSTLIEIPERSPLKTRLDFNVAEMVSKVGEEERFSSIIADVNGEEWVHTGIAFFGGGKNYSVFENKAGNPLSSFEVALADVGKDFLTAAAGNENFYFMLCSNESSFSPAEQERLLASEEAYACLYIKD